jgi:predicted ATPase
MLKRLHLKHFKSFREAELTLGPLTILVGANASGKSNIREALRFLHGVSRGYTLAEIFGEKWGDQGVLEWRGIRGGAQEVTYRHAPSCSVAMEMEEPWFDNTEYASRFSLEVGIDKGGLNPRVLRESLLSLIKGEGEGRWDEPDALVYRTAPAEVTGPSLQPDEVEVQFVIYPSDESTLETDSTRVRRDRPVLCQLFSEEDVRLGGIVHRLSAMRFLDLSPDEMRRAVSPGQAMLTDRGENLSSVLHRICANEASKDALLHWLRLLTPMDVADLAFPMDPAGRVLLSIVEQDGTTISAYSASDGTLRFLGILAALLSPRPPSVLFLEEIENGLHPSRLRLLLDLLRERTRNGDLQVIATTHSPVLVSLLDDDTLAHTSLFFRREGEPDAQIQRLLELPDAARVLKQHDRAHLLASGWFENVVEFAAVPSEPVAPIDPIS